MKNLIIVFIFTLLSYVLFRQPVYLSSLHQQENKTDPRIEKLDRYFASVRSPLWLSAGVFIDTADKYSLDWRILPAIAMVESTGGKFVPGCAPFNPFGWSSSSSPCGYWRFNSFDEAITFVGRGIGRGRTYIKFQQDKKLLSLAEIYNPNPLDWNSKVRYFMEQIK